MKKLLLALALLICTITASAEIVTLPIPGAPGLSITVGTGANALPLQEIKNNPNAVNITTWDDWYTEVPLGFNFPFFGQTFTNSWAATNGYVTFQNPQTSGLGGGCCSGVDLRNTTNPAYNYTIFGMHTDLYSWNGQNQYYLRGNNEMTYGWYGLSQCCSSQGGNSFEIKINSAGIVDTRIAGAMVQWNAVTSGMSGNLANGEYFQYYHGSGWNINSAAGAVSWNTNGGFTGTDQCTINPLSSPTCPGYTTAQCTISALYSTACPGYQQAFFSQQCSANPMYDINCPGYASAYLSYQCSINPLYSTTCQGYESAYLQQQCSANALYSTSCTGYDEAYLSQQCSLNSLYSTSCPGYASSYFSQQCTISGLYSTSCPNYADAYFAQQCSLNGLYNTRCPNYAQAYATQQALTQTSTSTTQTSSPTPTSVATVSTVTPTTTVSNDGTVSTGVSATGNSTVDAVMATSSNSTSATSATSVSPVSVTSTVSQSSSSQSASAPTSPVAVAAAEQKKEEKKDAPSTSVSSTSTAQNTTSDSGTKAEQPKTARQELQERRVAAARARAVEDGKNLASNMGKIADIESQKAVQNVVIAAMGYTPGFDAYNKVVMRDVIGYKPYVVYANQTNVDNRRLSRGLTGPSDRLHEEMVNEQYRR